MATNPYVNKVQYGNTVLIDLTGDTATAADVVSGKTFHDRSGEQKTGSYTPPSPSLQTKTASASTTQQDITPDSGYDGLSKVTISAATKQSKTVTPSTSQQTVTPDSGYYGLSQVTVDAVPSEETHNTSVTASANSGNTITSNGTYAISGTKTDSAINKLITNVKATASGSVVVNVPGPSGNISLGTYTSNGSKSANVSGYATCSFTVNVSSSAGTPTWGKSTSGSPGVSVNTSGYTINCTSFYPMAIKISEGPSSSGYPYEGIIVRSSNTEGSTGTGLLYKTGSSNTCATMSTYQSYTKFYSNKVVVGTSSSSRKLKSYTIYGFTVS